MATKYGTDDLEHFLETALHHGQIRCPECFSPLEADAPACPCGWENPLPAHGLI